MKQVVIWKIFVLYFFFIPSRRNIIVEYLRCEEIYYDEGVVVVVIILKIFLPCQYFDTVKSEIHVVNIFAEVLHFISWITWHWFLREKVSQKNISRQFPLKRSLCKYFHFPTYFLKVFGIRQWCCNYCRNPMPPGPIRDIFHALKCVLNRMGWAHVVDTRQIL